jgi:hypothetical protein
MLGVPICCGPFQLTGFACASRGGWRGPALGEITEQQLTGSRQEQGRRQVFCIFATKKMEVMKLLSRCVVHGERAGAVTSLLRPRARLRYFYSSCPFLLVLALIMKKRSSSGFPEYASQWLKQGPTFVPLHNFATKV